MTDPLAQATQLHATLDASPDTRTLLPLLEPLLEALRAREGLLPWIVAVDPADRPGFRDDFTTGFNVFWTVYPVKVGKLKAKQAAWKAARRGDWPGWEAVCLAVEAQKESPRWKGGTIPNPSTWFNGGRWDDDPATMAAIGGRNNGAPVVRLRPTCACEACSSPCSRYVPREGDICPGCSTGHDHRWPTLAEMGATP